MRASYNGATSIALVTALMTVNGAGSVAAQDSALIPYQGQLADQSGAPVSPEEPITLVFRTYTQPIGGVANWEEAHERVQVVAGRFSALLGARQPFPENVLEDFKRTVYLGVTVDDGVRETADIEMRPRQAIVPVIAARRALRADRADMATEAEFARAAEVAERLSGESAMAIEVARLRAALSDLISYVVTLRERISDLEED